MGFSPGDFSALVDNDDDKALLHFEQKDGKRIVLWNFDESHILFEVDAEAARNMIHQLSTCLYAMGEEP